MSDILLDIQEKLNDFTDVERRIAEYILQNSKEVLTMSTQKLAKKCGVSPAAIIRFSRNMGLGGFPDLKIHLSANLSENTSDVLLREVEENAEIAEIKRNIQHRMERMGKKTSELLDDQMILSAEEKIDHAQTVYVYGIGASSLVAQDIAQKFIRIGKQALFFADLHLLVTAMLAQSETRVLVLISNTGETAEVLRAAKIAKENEIDLIAITGHAESTLGSMSETILLTATGEGFRFRTAATISLMAQLYVVDVLFYTYVSRHFEESETLLKRSKEAIQQIWED
ncbi:transcriptional regulator, RpiR family [Pilibacter termitis]|jgi:DNA-binding MurR/RpiR family transcriptional regulator|uniref:Transcriptional regulator, RpiR family n=1 Tax=Pilibacter termitis TaxID=263852 RepID=A0A1T4LLW0_9ENTE|nr:MurR/RpiR family transcriptional regulator [Pilibacter termitis]SJZ55702.1 transcriptional regulator, RpiR family [Pilibacter termitis]